MEQTLKKKIKLLSLDFIAGLVNSEGSFMLTKQNKGQQKVFAFQLKMDYQDRELLLAVKNSLGLKEKVHEYDRRQRHYVLLLVRRRETIKKIIIPAFDNKLYGQKGIQFNEWREQFFEEERKWEYQYTPTVKPLE